MRAEGFVLPATLILLVLIGLGLSAAWFLLQADLRAIGRERAALQAAYTAEASLLAAAAALPPRVDPLRFQDDQWVPGQGELVVFPGPPYGFRLFLREPDRRANSPEQLHVFAKATAVAGAGRNLEGVLVEEALPYAPAGLLIVDGTLMEDRGSTLRADPEHVVVEGYPGVAALAAGSARALWQLQTQRPKDRVTVARPIDVQLFLQDIDPPFDVGSQWELSAVGPSVLYLQGGTINGLRGEGLLVASGDLRLEGSIDFAGVLLVAGTLTLATTSCVVRGFVQVAMLEAKSGCRFRPDPDAVRFADTLQPLPRAVRLQGTLVPGSPLP